MLKINKKYLITNSSRPAVFWGRKPVYQIQTANTLLGEKSEVCLRVLVDKLTAHLLNAGKDKLYDILVLHLLGGKDLFITASILRLSSPNI